MPEIYTVSSLEKVLLHKKPKTEKKGKMAKNETFSFQIAYKYNRFANDIEVKIDSQINDYITYRQVEYVPCTSVNLWEGDGFCLSKDAFVCPDVLRPTKGGKLKSRACAYSSAWFTVKGDLPVGKHKIKITLQAQWCDPLVAEYELEVLDFELKDKEFVYTNWFHYDGISNYYNLPVFSKKYNEIMYDFIEKAVAHGVNMLLIPMFTPPLDTRVGGERKTVQLIDVYYNDGKYSFDFDRLIDFMKKVQSMGIEYFEMSHLFAQWGAKCAPKIVATVNGKKKKIFGWKNGATSTEYTEFLGELLPKLRQRLIDEGFYSKCRFHLSDEPNENCIEDYKKAHSVFKKSMPDAFITDALSHYDFHKDGLVDVAVCSIRTIDIFLENNIKNLFAYYCCAESGDFFTNRYMSYTSWRTRVLGIQLYLNKISGFLHWGYNFYNSVLSDEPIDPYLITDGGGGYQSGDAFIVYPGENGAYDSLRHEVFYDGLQDMRLLYTLEEKIGREKVENLLLSYGFEKGFRVYPHDEKVFFKLRNEIHKLMSEG